MTSVSRSNKDVSVRLTFHTLVSRLRYMTFAETCLRWTLKSSHWTVFFLHLVSRVSWTLPAEGQSRVIGSPKPITAASGDDVILPCHLEPPVDARWFTLEWTRTDASDGGGYVYFRRGAVELRDMKIPRYADRAALFADELRRGNLSLSIGNVTTADAGTYRCLVPRLKNHVIVRLIIVERETWTAAPLTTTDLQTPDPGVTTDANGGRSRPGLWILAAIVIVMLATTAAAAFIVKRRRRDAVRNEHKDAGAASGLVVAVTPGKRVCCVEGEGGETLAAAVGTKTGKKQSFVELKINNLGVFAKTVNKGG